MKVAIIGRGFGNYAMKPAYRALGWDVEMVAARDEAALDAAFSGDADLISVHSPPFQHRDHVLRAVAAGKHVLCDKPFGRNADEAREMLNAAQQAGVLHFLNYEFRHQPARIKVRDLIQSGAIGQLRHMATTSFANYLHGRPHGWLNDADLGGGWIGAYGSHVIDALRWYAGAEVAQCGGVLRIDAKSHADANGTEVKATAEDAYSLWFATDNGISASLDVAFSLPVSLPQRMQFIGTDGLIELIDNTVLTLHRRGAEPELFDLSPPAGERVWPAIRAWLEAVGRAIATGQPITPDFKDGLAAAKVMDQLKATALRV